MLHAVDDAEQGERRWFRLLLFCSSLDLNSGGRIFQRISILDIFET